MNLNMNSKVGLLIILGILFLALFGLTGCEEGEKSTDTYYVKTNFILVEKEKCGDSKTMIIRHPEKEFMYRELTNSGMVTDEMYYTYEVGDEMYFEYLRKERFFGVDPEDDKYVEVF